MKDKTIFELQDKIKFLTDLYNTSNKSCHDYEDILNGLKRTIEIFKKSNDNNESESLKLRTIINETNSTLDKKTEDYQDLERSKCNLQNDNNILKNEINLL